jgi:TatD DNase family protein
MLRGYKTKSAYTDFSTEEIQHANTIITQAYDNDTKLIINVGTDLIESLTCIKLAQLYENCYAIVGIHPNDTTENWKSITGILFSNFARELVLTHEGEIRIMFFVVL